MTHKIRITNPKSLVQLALYAFETYEAVAEATNTSLSTVIQWRTNDKVPNRHLPTLSSKANLDTISLFRYCKERHHVKSRVKPSSVIDALINGSPHPNLDDTRRKQLLTVWGERLGLLKAQFEALSGPTYPDQEAYGQVVDGTAAALHVSKTHVYRLMRLFSVQRKPFKATANRINTHKEAKNKRISRTNAAISAVKGQKTVKKLAEELSVSERTLFRYVDDVLAPYQGVTLQVLTRYPDYFRLAVANEIEHKDKSLLAMKIKAVFDEFPQKSRFKMPKDLKRADYKTKFISVLTAEVSLNDLSSLTGTPLHMIEEAFNRYCVPFGMSWATLKGSSVYHQAFFAEILKGSNHGI